MKPPEGPDRLLSVVDLVDRWGLPEGSTHVLELVDRGELIPASLALPLRFRQADVVAYERRRDGPPSPPPRPSIYRPAAAAAELGISLVRLARLVSDHGLAFTELVPGGRPGQGKAGSRWGLTPEQLDAVRLARDAPGVASPTDAAEALETTVMELVRLLREHDLPYTGLSPGARPGKRGARWGLTRDQLDRVRHAYQSEPIA